MGNRSTITQYTVLILKDVRASKIQERIKFSNDVLTKYRPIVTTPAAVKLKTKRHMLIKRAIIRVIYRLTQKEFNSQSMNTKR